MADKKDSISRGQFTAICAVGLLSPAVRLLPGLTASLAGRAAWLSPLPAYAVMVAHVFMTSHIMGSRGEGEGFGEIILRTLGPALGRAVLALFAIWLAFYSGFLLRSSSERFVTTIFTRTRPWIFTLVMFAAVLMGGMGRVSPLGRLAELFRAIFAVVFIIVLALDLPNVSLEELFPVTGGDVGGILRAAVAGLDVAGIAVYFTFLEGHTQKQRGRSAVFIMNFALLTLLVMAMIGVVVASFGPQLASKFSLPFFVMIKDIHILDSFQRVEAVVIALWVVSDFVLISALLMITGKLARLVTRRGRREFHSLACAAAALAVGLSLSPSGIGLERWSEFIVPIINLSFVFVFIPIIYIVWLVKKRKKVEKKP